MAGVKDGIWKRGNNWYISVKVNGRRRVKSFGRDRKAAELALAEILKHRAVANATNDWSGLAEFTKGWLAQVLGHSTLQTTFKHYARFIKDTSRENEDRLEKMLSMPRLPKAKQH